MRNLWKSAHIVRLGSLCYKLSKIPICNYFPNSTELKPGKLDRNEMNTRENIHVTNGLIRNKEGVPELRCKMIRAKSG